MDKRTIYRSTKPCCNDQARTSLLTGSIRDERHYSDWTGVVKIIFRFNEQPCYADAGTIPWKCLVVIVFIVHENWRCRTSSFLPSKDPRRLRLMDTLAVALQCLPFVISLSLDSVQVFSSLRTETSLIIYRVVLIIWCINSSQWLRYTSVKWKQVKSFTWSSNTYRWGMFDGP